MAEGSTGSVDLGPGPLMSGAGSPFDLPSDGWARIRDFVGAVSTLPANVASELDGLLDGFAELQGACAAWQATTFPAIVSLATGVHTYGTQTVPEVYGRLKPELEALEGAGAGADPATVKSTLAELRGHATGLATQAAGLVAPVQAFTDANTRVVQSLKADGIGAARAMAAQPPGSSGSGSIAQFASLISSIAAVTSTLATSPVGVVRRLDGCWHAIASDLAFTSDWVAGQITARKPFLAELAVDAAIEDWADVAREAEAFAALTPARS